MCIRPKSKKAFVVVEAAIFLPIFIIALVTIGYVLRGVGTTETVMHCLVNQGKKLSVEAYVKNKNYEEFFELESGPEYQPLKRLTREWLSQGTLLLRVQRQLREETGNWIQNLDVAQFKENYEQDGRNALTMISLKYTLPIPVPSIFVSEMNFQERIVFRAFVGKNSFGQVRSFSEMELEKDAETVYVFPRAGERYHGKSCRILRQISQKTLLSLQLKKKYDPCKTCQPQTMPMGSIVYVFKDSGEVYHRGSCSSVQRFVIPMEKEEAEQKGYTPCHICGGESSWFH